MYYCFHELGILPHEYFERPKKEKMLITAFVDYKAELDKKEIAKQRANARSSKRRRR